jgi:hypothetical protein
MITNGFVPKYGDLVTIGTRFTSNGLPCVSYIIGAAVAGDLVWLNAQGQAQFSPGLLAGQEYILGAVEIVASATVNGVSRTTTAASLYWRGGTLNNTP